MTRLLLMSDLHGHLPADLPDHDIAVIAGDVMPLWASPHPTLRELAAQHRWILAQYLPWVSTLSCVVQTWGKHDGLFDPAKMPTGADGRSYGDGRTVTFPVSWPAHVHTLVQSGVTVRGLKFWGSPYSLQFYDWAFNLHPQALMLKWDELPLDTDVVVVHQPPRDHGDRTARGGHVGCPALLDRLRAGRPSLVVTGHIHEDRGEFPDATHAGRGYTIVNASLVNLHCQPVYPPIVYDL